MERNKSYHLHQRSRVIQHKLHVIENVWGRRIEDGHLWLKEPGRLSKEKLNCSCYMCKYEKHIKIPKANIKAKWDGMQEEIDEYFSDNSRS